MKTTLRILPVLFILNVGSVWAGAAEDALALASGLQKASQAQDERISHLEARLQSQGLLNLLNQIENLKAEISRLRGTNEELAQQLSVSDKRVKDLFADLDGRVRELAARPVPSPDAVRLHAAPNLVSAPTQTAADSEAETRAYEAVQALVKAGKYKEAIDAFQAFAKQFPNGTLTANAQYWTGFSQFALSDFKSAAASYQQLLKDFPTSAKAPDAMLSLSRALVQLNDIAAARNMLDQLIAKYPASKAAENGQKLLATLK